MNTDIDINQWHFEGIPFTPELAQQKIDGGAIGFIYEITDNLENKKYIGKKLLVCKRKLPPLKGQKRKRIKISQTDWVRYFGSSELVSSLVLLRKHDFTRSILMFCDSKGELNYREAEQQFLKGVLLSDSYYNNLIACKIHAIHVRRIKNLNVLT